MTPQSLYDLASSAFHDDEWNAYPVDSVPFADDLPEGVGFHFWAGGRMPFCTYGAILPCHHLPEKAIHAHRDDLPVVRNFLLLDLMAHLVGP